mmetsp:Transcript_11509/g.19146  ORF Transcript_11509/g.19146 Transcript_11509/m.19146 type:complete len:319 (+) Transcript_11509:56-1012(+)
MLRMQTKGSDFQVSSFVTIGFFVIRIVFGLEPDNERFSRTAKLSTSFLVHNLQGVIIATLISPLQNSLLFQSIFVKELLQKYRKVLWFLNAKSLQRSNQMTFHNGIGVGNGRDGRSELLDLLVLEELRSENRLDNNVNLIVGFESGSHLLVVDELSEIASRSVGVCRDPLLGGLHSKFQGAGIVNSNLRVDRGLIVSIVLKAVIVLLAKHGILEIVVFTFFSSTVLILFVLLLVLLFLLVFLTFLFIIVRVILLLLPPLGFLVLSLALLLGFLILSQNERGKLVIHIQHLFVTTSRALVIDAFVLNLIVCLWKTTLGA